MQLLTVMGDDVGQTRSKIVQDWRSSGREKAKEKGERIRTLVTLITSAHTTTGERKGKVMQHGVGARAAQQHPVFSTETDPVCYCRCERQGPPFARTIPAVTKIDMALATYLRTRYDRDPRAKSSKSSGWRRNGKRHVLIASYKPIS